MIHDKEGTVAGTAGGVTAPEWTGDDSWSSRSDLFVQEVIAAMTTAASFRRVMCSLRNTAASTMAKMTDIWLRMPATEAFAYLNPATQKSIAR